MANSIELTTPDYPAGPSDLLVIRAGQPVAKVMQEASCILESAIAIVRTEADSNSSQALWGGVTLIELAKDLIDASVIGVANRHASEVTHD
ncbi:hypothetical protein [Burkholderia sola]